jgi:hypothetical protein
MVLYRIFLVIASIAACFNVLINCTSNILISKLYNINIIFNSWFYISNSSQESACINVSQQAACSPHHAYHDLANSRHAKKPLHERFSTLPRIRLVGTKRDLMNSLGKKANYLYYVNVGSSLILNPQLLF